MDPDSPTLEELVDELCQRIDQAHEHYVEHQEAS